MSVFLIKTNKFTEIIFYFNKSIIEIIKQVDDVRFDINKKRWTVPTCNIRILTEKLKANDILYYIDDQTSSSSQLPARRAFSDITNMEILKVKIDNEMDQVYINLPIAPQLFHTLKKLDHVRDYNKNQMIIKGYAAFKKTCEDNNISYNITQN